MQPVEPRPINDRELAVLRTAIERAPLVEVSAALLESTRLLRVVGRCDCGCDSVTFEHVSDDSGEHGFRIADATGYHRDGEMIGVLVWGVSGQVSNLEVYNFTDNLPRLPDPSTLVPF